GAEGPGEGRAGGAEPAGAEGPGEGRAGGAQSAGAEGACKSGELRERSAQPGEGPQADVPPARRAPPLTIAQTGERGRDACLDHHHDRRTPTEACLPTAPRGRQSHLSLLLRYRLNCE